MSHDYSDSNKVHEQQLAEYSQLQSWSIFKRKGSVDRVLIVLGGFSEAPEDVLLRYPGIIRDAHVVGLYWPGFGLSKTQGIKFDPSSLLPVIQSVCDLYPDVHIDLLGHSFGARTYLTIIDKIDPRIHTIHLISPVLKLGWWEGLVAYFPSRLHRNLIHLVFSPSIQHVFAFFRLVGSKESRFLARFKAVDQVESLMHYYLRSLKDLVGSYAKVNALLSITKFQIKIYLFKDDKICNTFKWISEIKPSSRVEIIELKGRHFSRIQ